VDSEEIKSLYARQGCVQGFRSKPWVDGDQLKAAGELSTKQISCRQAICVPPVGCLATLPRSS
jgi:hypothetical protein